MCSGAMQTKMSCRSAKQTHYSAAVFIDIGQIRWLNRSGINNQIIWLTSYVGRRAVSYRYISSRSCKQLLLRCIVLLFFRKQLPVIPLLCTNGPMFSALSNNKLIYFYLNNTMPPSYEDLLLDCASYRREQLQKYVHCKEKSLRDNKPVWV